MAPGRHTSAPGPAVPDPPTAAAARADVGVALTPPVERVAAVTMKGEAA